MVSVTFVRNSPNNFAFFFFSPLFKTSVACVFLLERLRMRTCFSPGIAASQKGSRMPQKLMTQSPVLTSGFISNVIPLSFKVAQNSSKEGLKLSKKVLAAHEVSLGRQVRMRTRCCRSHRRNLHRPRSSCSPCPEAQEGTAGTQQLLLVQD